MNLIVKTIKLKNKFQCLNKGNKMDNLKSILIKRDGLSNDEADKAIRQARIELNERLINNEDYDYFMEEEFGLESDYIFDLI